MTIIVTEPGTLPPAARRAALVALVVAASMAVAGGVLFATSGQPPRDRLRAAAPTPSTVPAHVGASANPTTGVGILPPPSASPTTPAELPISVSASPVTPPNRWLWTMTVPAEAAGNPPRNTLCNAYAGDLRAQGGVDQGTTWVAVTVRAGKQAAEVAIERIRVRRLRALPALAAPDIRCVPGGDHDPRPSISPHVTLDSATEISSSAYGGAAVRRLAPGDSFTQQLYVAATAQRHEWDLQVTLRVNGHRSTISVRDGSRPFTLNGGLSGRNVKVWCEGRGQTLVALEKLLSLDPNAPPCRGKLLGGLL